METPILSVINDEQAETPLPGLQMTVLLLSLLCEPASAFVIYPFVTKVGILVYVLIVMLQTPNSLSANSI